MIDSYDEKKYANYGYNAPNAAPAYAPQPQMNNFSGVAKIKVIGVGGAGNNAVDRLIESGMKGAEYIVVNTDNQALARSKANQRIQIGVKSTKGLGAGADPKVGREAAEENKDALAAAIKDTDLLFITAGMGGGTGTGAAPIIAKIAREMKVITIAVVTMPFSFEAKRRMDNALSGIEELSKYVDAIITVPNDKIRQIVDERTSFEDALRVADEVLHQGIRGITELIIKPSIINLDLADVKTTLKDSGIAHIGIGASKGENRILEAVRFAVCSPLLNTTIQGAKSVIINVIGGKDLSLDEVTQAANIVKDIIDYSANVIFGACIDEHMSDEVEIVIIATGFDNSQFNAMLNGDGNTAQQAAILSKRINQSVYNTRRQEGGYPQQTIPPYMGAQQQPVPPLYPNNTMPQAGYGYPQGNPVPYPQDPNRIPFEPNDPIPDSFNVNSSSGGEKKKGRVVDYFFNKKKKDNK